jgi:hypothetical protein
MSFFFFLFVESTLMIQLQHVQQVWLSQLFSLHWKKKNVKNKIKGLVSFEPT